MTNKWPLISQQEEGLFKVTLYTFYDPFQMWQVVPHCCFFFLPAVSKIEKSRSRTIRKFINPRNLRSKHSKWWNEVNNAKAPSWKWFRLIKDQCECPKNVGIWTLWQRWTVNNVSGVSVAPGWTSASLSASCFYDQGPMGPRGPSGPSGKPGDDVSVLTARS